MSNMSFHVVISCRHAQKTNRDTIVFCLLAEAPTGQRPPPGFPARPPPGFNSGRLVSLLTPQHAQSAHPARAQSAQHAREQSAQPAQPARAQPAPACLPSLHVPPPVGLPTTSLPPDLEALNAENYDFINGQRAKSTVQKTRRDATRFLDYLEALGVGRNPETMSPHVLCPYLATFMWEVKKADGTDYEPDTINSIQGSIDRHLREQGYPYSITESSEFKMVKEVVEAKRKMLKGSGKGNNPMPRWPLQTKRWTSYGFRGGLAAQTQQS